MSIYIIFIVGLVVTAITVRAVLAVGLSEAADPTHSKERDLTDWERSIVDRKPSSPRSP